MAGYPITLQLENKSVLIVGGGKVAARKATALIAAGAKVTVISPSLDKSFNSLTFDWIQGEYSGKYFLSVSPLLVFAATDDPDVNMKIFYAAMQRRVLVNLVDAPELSDFHNMAVIEKAPFTIAISSDGNSPALLHILKERVAAAITGGISTLGTWLGSLRSVTKITIDSQEDRQALYERIVSSEVLALLESGKHDEAKALFDSMVEEAL